VSALARLRDPAIVATLVLAAAAMVHAARWTFLCDDAYISFRYAVNLAEHGELAFNVDPLERVEGYTNFAWVLALAALAVIGVPPERAALGLGFVAFAALLACVVAIVTRAAGDTPHAKWAPLPAIALLAASPEAVVWATGGLETAAAVALVLGSAVAWEAGRPRTAAVLAAAAVLTRPDGALILAAWGSAWMLVHHRSWWRSPHRHGARRMLAAAACLVVPLCVHLLWRRSYYGTWLPNTWAVKAHGAALRDTWGIAYVQQWSTAMWLPYLAPAVVLLRRAALPWLAVITATLAYGWSVGGDFMAYSRFFLVTTVALAITLALAVHTATVWVATRWPRWHALPVAVALVAAAALARQADARWHADRSKPEGWIDGKWEGVTAMARFAEVGRAAGAWLGAHVPADTLITVGAAGAVPYASRLPTVDAFGLVDPVIATLDPPPLRTGPGVRPGHQLFAPPQYIRDRDPDLLCHVGFRGATPPRESDARPPYRHGYIWACATPGAGSARDADGAPFDPGVYCCRRPHTRIIGPFGAGPEVGRG